MVNQSSILFLVVIILKAKPSSNFLFSILSADITTYYVADP